MGKILRGVMLVLGVVMMGFAAYKLWRIDQTYATADTYYEEVAGQVAVAPAIQASSAAGSPASGAPTAIDFAALRATNPDVVGWIYGAGTPIHYPVVQTLDNSYYLHRLIDGSAHRAGTIFMDYRNRPDMSDLNTIIYGHNMRDGTMFGTITAYQSQAYYDDHPELILYTPAQTYRIVLLAGYETTDTDPIYTNLPTLADQQILVTASQQQSDFSATATFTPGDRLVTLSTCAAAEGPARYVLVGKLVAK